MKALITGIGGFVGGHLARQLLSEKHVEIIGTTFFPVDNFAHLSELGIILQQMDLTDEGKLHTFLEQHRPDQIYHLAAQSFVPESFDNPWGTLSNNIQSQLNILHSMIELNLSGRILIIGSGDEYGPISPDDIPVNEDQPLRPPNPYSVSKVAQDMLGLQYYLSHDLPVIRVRPFNHIGPGQNERFVASAFARQIAQIEADNQEPVMRVGNLTSRRDFTDVRDMVHAYSLVMKLGEPGSVYNIGSGQAHSIQEMLDILLKLTESDIQIDVDPALMRPVDVPIIVCDNTKIQATTGWQPAYTFEQTLSDILDDWRQRV